MARALSGRVARIERAVGVACPACADRPALGILFHFEGRVLDAHAREVDPAWLVPCPRCGRTCGPNHGIKMVVGVDPLYV